MRAGEALRRVEQWFRAQGWKPFEFQREVWEAYREGTSGLVHAPTGTGKTYAAWMGPLIEFLCRPDQPGSGLRVLWLTPLRALASETVEALRAPLGALGIAWQVEARTGDTTAAQRARMRRRMPEALVTTPESLSLLLSYDSWREIFSPLRLVVADEWHELLGSKRGVQAELALARLRRLQPALRVWGLSATIGNLDQALEVLLGASRDRPAGRLVRGLAPKQVEIDCLLPPTMERFPWAGHLGANLLPQVVAALEDCRSALVFTNTRSQTELWYQAILEARPQWAGAIALHHGSLDPKLREWVGDSLAGGRLRCVVCTSSLDLGVDFACVDRVLQVGSPKGVARLLQRAGRSGHQPGAVSRVTCVPAHAFELVEVAAARDAINAGELEARAPLTKPLDLLAQHVVTVALGGGFQEEELFAEIRDTHAYQQLTRQEWLWVLDFASRGGAALANYPEYSRLVCREGFCRVESRRLAQRHRMMIGTITSDNALRVQYLGGGVLGNIEESFIAKLKPGARFLFAGRLLELVRVRDLTAWVRKAAPGTGAVPRWMGGRMPLSTQLAAAVRRKLEQALEGRFEGPEMEAVRPILELQKAWSRLPRQNELLIERLATREGYHVFCYPFEGMLVHEGLAALVAYRLCRIRPLSIAITPNDYGFEMLCPDPIPLEQALERGLFDPAGLQEDIRASMNATEMARRQFREIARVAGLVFQGYPGQGKAARQLQASSGLIFDVLEQYDPDNLLLHQARREVLEAQLEHTRLYTAMQRLSRARVVIAELERCSPLGFPLMAMRIRSESLSSEKLEDRIRRMQMSLEKAAS